MYIEGTCDNVVRILFLIKLQMAVEAEPKLLKHLGSEMWWENRELGSGPCDLGIPLSLWEILFSHPLKKHH